MRTEARAPLATDFERAGVVDDGVVLATERDRTELARRQTDEGLTAEFVAALAQTAGHDVKAVFQHEDGLQTTTQIFRATQAPTAAL